MNIPTKEILFKRAKADLVVANFLLTNFNTPSAELDLAAYHMQQTVEKLITYQIYAVSGEYTKTHDIPYLVNKAGKLKILIPLNIRKMAEKLKKYESLGRYSNAFITDIQKLYNYYSDIEKYFNLIQTKGVLLK